jgi:MFS family permease
MDLLNELFSLTGLVGRTSATFLGKLARQWAHGNFIHDAPFALPDYTGSLIYGVLVHYSIGGVLAALYTLLVRTDTGLVRGGSRAVLYGMCTSVFAWFVLFPSIGFGLFGLDGPPQFPVFRSSLFNHLFYGVGLAISAKALNGAARFIGDSGIVAETGVSGEGVSRIGKVSGSFLLSLASAQAVAAGCTGIVFMMVSLALVQLSGGDKSWSGIPTAAILLTSALAAFPIGRAKDARGYRSILKAALGVGFVGALLGAVGAQVGSRVLLVVACCATGVANCAILMSRFAAAEVAVLQQRARAMSIVMTGATAGAIGGPALAGAADRAGKQLGMDVAALPLASAALIYVVGFVVVHWGLKSVSRNDEARIARAPETKSAAPASTAGSKSLLVYSMASVLCGQVAMVGLMAVTPVHMHGHSHGVGAISAVLAGHFFGMYGVSFLAGWLADRVGRHRVIQIGCLILLSSSALGYWSSSLPVVFVALFLLGMGWNFCFISAGALLADQLRGTNKGKLQGMNDALISLGSGSASLASGVILAHSGFAVVAALGGTVAAVPLLLSMLIATRSMQPKSVQAAAE